MKKNYRELSEKTIEHYAKASGVWVKGEIWILTGFNLWYTTTAREIKNNLSTRIRFWRMIFLGPLHTHAASPVYDETGCVSFYKELDHPYMDVPAAELIDKGMVPHRCLNDWMLVAKNRTKSFRQCYCENNRRRGEKKVKNF